jgi:hypothetical protein
VVVRRAQRLAPVTGGSIGAESMKDAMQNPIFWDEKCNAPAQTAGSRSSGSHQSCRSGYFRTDF